MNPLAIDLFCGLGGWTEGLLAEGYDVVGFDNECHEYGDERYPAQLVIQDVLTLHGSQFRDADLIVASPPCTEYSYMAMPWTRAKQIARALQGEDEFPEGYHGSRTIGELTALFDACFRIQREACEAAGRHVPMVVENVRGAQPWVGRSQWNYGSFHLWGDVPALMPMTKQVQKVPGFRFDGSGKSFQTAAVEGVKVPGLNWSSPDKAKRGCFRDSALKMPRGDAERSAKGRSATLQHYDDLRSSLTGTKQPGISGARNNGKGDRWFQDGAAQHGSKSTARKMASAMIAKIPFELSRHIAQVYAP